MSRASLRYRFGRVAVVIVLISGGAGAASAQDVFAPTSNFGPFIRQVPLPIHGQTAISGDTALVEAGGVVHVFERDSATDTWTEVAQLTPSDSALNFGRDIAVDRETVIVGAEGGAYVFRRRERPVPAWLEAAKLVPSDADPAFGGSVDVDRVHAVVSGTGGPYVFKRNRGGRRWREVARLESNGFTVGISGDVAIVGGGGSGPRRQAHIFGRDQGGPDNWGLVKNLDTFPEFFADAVIDADVAMVSTNDPGFFGSFIHVFRRDSGGPDAWDREPMYVAHDRGTVAQLSLSGDLVADIAFNGARISARNQGFLTAPSWNPIIGGPNAWGPVTTLFLSGPQRPASVAIGGDTALVAVANSHVEVLVSDIDGDGIRDGRDPCVRDPLNNVEGGCERASLVYPMLDDFLTEDSVTTETVNRRFIITATFTNTSQTAVKNPFFEVSELTGRNVLVNSDAGRGGVGSTLSPDVGDGVLSPGESLAVTFVIRLRSDGPFQFHAVFRGDPMS